MTEERTIIIDRQEIEERRGMTGGPTLAQIDVTNGDGRTARFWVSVNIRNGRPRLDITGLGRNTDHEAHVSSAWHNFRS